MTPDRRRYFTVAEAADYLRVGVDSIRAAVHEGDLIAKRVGKGPRAPFRITGDALDDWFDGFPNA